MTPDDACRSVYQGDAALDRMLAKAGAMVNAIEAKAIIAGVLAAPAPLEAPQGAPGQAQDAWLALVAPDPSPALAAQLRALKAVLESEAAP